MPLLFLFAYVVVGAFTYGLAQRPCAYANMGDWNDQATFEDRVDVCSKMAGIGWPIYWPNRLGAYVAGGDK